MQNTDGVIHSAAPVISGAHQDIVMYAKNESERLLYVRTNQKKLRVDDYIHLRDAIANDGNTNNVGQLMILLSTVTGSPRGTCMNTLKML